MPRVQRCPESHRPRRPGPRITGLGERSTITGTHRHGRPSISLASVTAASPSIVLPAYNEEANIERAGLPIQWLTGFNAVLFLPAAAIRLLRGRVRPDTSNHQDGPIKSDFSMKATGAREQRSGRHVRGGAGAAPHDRSRFRYLAVCVCAETRQERVAACPGGPKDGPRILSAMTGSGLVQRCRGL